MSRILLYSSGIIAEEKPTGGELRFLELAGYLAGNRNAELCCADSEQMLKPYGLRADIHLKPARGNPAFLPEEARIWLSNRTELKRISKTDYTDVIVFDVPPAMGLVFSGARNLVLMVRKDLIGYEKVKSAGNGLSKRIRIAYEWICEDLCLRRAKLVICQCGYDRDTILRRHLLQKRKLSEKFAVQINNVNPSWVRNRADEARAETRTDGHFRVCFIGGFDDLRKGQELFLKSAEKLKDDCPEMEFVLVGGGKKLEKYQKQYESDRIRFLGRMKNPLAILKNSDLLVVPSLADSCPNTVMEALYLNVPVIGSRAGGIPEILQNEEALFDLEQQALQEKIRYFYTDTAAREKLKTEQRARAETLSFDWAEKIMGIVQETGQEQE